MSDQTMVVNGRHVSWGDLSINNGYGALLGIKEISWNEKQEKEAQYGKGFMPTGVGKGNYEATGKLTITKDEFDNEFMTWVRAQVGDALASPVEVPAFTITATYALENGGPAHTTRLLGVEITSVEEGGSQGDKALDVSMELLILKKVVRV